MRGAGYLGALAQQLQPGWGQFLEDCRLRLPANDPLNAHTLATAVELVIDRKGALVSSRVTSSGNASFDRAATQVIADAQPLSAPPPDLASDDDLVHVRWLFARDGRQAGSATASIVTVQLGLAGVVKRLVAAGDLVRAARRVLDAPAGDPDRHAAGERVMIGALREALGSADAAVRRAAVEAIGRAKVTALAPDVRPMLASTTDLEMRVVALDAIGALADGDAAPLVVGRLATDVLEQDRLALAETRALVKLGHADDAAKVLRTILDGDGLSPHVIAVRALAIVPIASFAAKLPRWLASGDVRTRSAVCEALSAGAPGWSAILRGLRDRDAGVRATCLDAVVAQLHAKARPDIDVRSRVDELVTDRDASVRARAVVAVAAMGRPIKPTADPSPDVRTALAAATRDASYAADREPEVRAAYVTSTIGHGTADATRSIAMTAAADPAWQVRRAAIAGLPDDKLLGKLAGDDSEEVASAALVRISQLRGRAVMTDPLLVRVAAASPGSAGRVRTALAWLLAS